MPDLETATPPTVVAVYAHPDDAEVSCGGTLARWAAAGARVHVCIATLGDKGSSDPSADPHALAARRRAEVEAASTVLGLAGCHWLGHADGELEDGPLLRAEVVSVVRRLRPHTVLCPDPTAVFFGQRYVNHRDHRVIGWVTVDAVAPAAANPHYFPDAGPAHGPDVLLLSGALEPDVWVDISDTIDVKARALACHQSQVGEPGEWLRTVVRQRAEEAGRRAGVRFAEGFRRVVLRD